MQMIEYKNKNKFDNDFIYSNQWISLTNKTTLNEKINIGAQLDKKASGGQISHINVQSNFKNFEQAWDLTNHIANKGLIYFAYNSKINVCEDGHGFNPITDVGLENNICHCGKPMIDQFSKVVGFLTPRSAYSKERKKEFDNRQWFNLIE